MNMRSDDGFMADEAKASFARHFMDVAQMQASVEEKVRLFQAKTKLVQHFLGLQSGEQFGDSYQKAGNNIKQLICNSASEAISQSGLPNAAELACRAKMVDMSSQENALAGLFSLFSPEKMQHLRLPKLSVWDIPL